MKLQSTFTVIGVLLALACATVNAQPVGAAFPGNEAVRTVDGKRVVELPPLTPTAQRSVPRHSVGGANSTTFRAGSRK